MVAEQKTWIMKNKRRREDVPTTDQYENLVTSAETVKAMYMVNDVPTPILTEMQVASPQTSGLLGEVNRRSGKLDN